jgi:phosphonate transport system ATP-binding protein
MIATPGRASDASANGQAPSRDGAEAPSRDRAPAVRVTSLRKEFGTTVALDDVTLDIHSGEMTVVIGLSGSGKSTLLRHLNGLHRPTSGTVEVLGRDVNALKGRGLRELRRDVGFVFQQFNIVGRLTVMENVLSGALGRLRGPRFGVSSYPRQLRREALELLDRVGLGDRAFQRTDTLSGGQQQRCAIARTIMQRPQLVLADEPVASLDPEISGQVMEVLMRICTEEGLTVLCSLHQVDLALGWADRMIGLRDGCLVLDKPVAGLAHDEVMSVYRRLDPTGEKLAEYAGPMPAAAGR